MSLEPGYYRGALQEAVVSETPNGKLQASLIFLLAGLETKRTVRLSFEGGARPYTLDKLNGLGWNGDIVNMDFDEAKSGDVELVMKLETYTNREGEEKTKESWDLANWGGGAIDKQASDDKLRRLQAELKHAGVKITKPAGAPAAPPARGAAPVAAPTRPAAAPQRPAGSMTAEQLGTKPASMTRDQSYAVFVEVNQGAMTPEAIDAAFFEAIDNRAAKCRRAEEAFTGEDWFEVSRACVPF